MKGTKVILWNEDERLERTQTEIMSEIPDSFNSYAVTENRELRIIDIWGEPNKFSDLTKIQYDRGEIHRYHVDHKEETNESHEVYQSRMSLWENLYLESVNITVKHFSEKVDKLIKTIYCRDYPCILKDEKFILSLKPQIRECLQRIKNPKSYRVEQFSDVERFRKELADAQRAEKKGQSWGHSDPNYIKRLIASELEHGQKKALEQKKSDLEQLPRLQVIYMLNQFPSEDIKSLLTMFRKDIPDYIHKTAMDLFNDYLESKTENMFSSILNDSIIYSSNTLISLDDVLKEQAGTYPLCAMLTPQDVWKEDQVKPKSRVFKDIAFGMTYADILNTEAVQSKSVRLQKKVDQEVLESEWTHSDVFGLTKLFGDEAVVKMKFGWVLNKDANEVLALKKQLVAIEFIPATVEELRKTNEELMGNIFGDFEELEGNAKMAQNLRDIGAVKAANPYQKESYDKFSSMIANRQSAQGAQKAHAEMMLKWLKGLEAGERPYRFIQGINLTSEVENLMGMRNNKSYYTNVSFIEKGNNTVSVSEADQNIADLNIAEISNGGLRFYPARQIDQTPKIGFINLLLLAYHQREFERHQKELDINKNKNDF